MSVSKDQLDALGELVTRFRLALESHRSGMPIGLQDFPNGACGDASLLLGRYLGQNGIENITYVKGTKGTQTHAWLEIGEIIVDITADQFGDQKRVIVTTDKSWHQQFESQTTASAGLDQYRDPNSDALRAAFAELVKFL